MWNYTSAAEPAAAADLIRGALADLNGDGRADLIAFVRHAGGGWTWIGANVSSGAGPGTSRRTDEVVLAERADGLGRWTFASDFQPLTGYGLQEGSGFNFRAVQHAIRRAFLDNEQPLVGISPWPFPYDAAIVYRHDHVLNSALIDLESRSLVHGQPVQGEYYIQPDANEGGDFPVGVGVAQQKGAIIGAHTVHHVGIDILDTDNAYRWLARTVDDIAGGCTSDPFPNPGAASCGAPLAVEPMLNYVAPGAIAVRPTSMLAIALAGFVTTGEQAVGPLPHFAVDMNTGGYVGTLLQVPVMGHMLPSPTSNCGGGPCSILAHNKLLVDVSYDSGGLINVYDHASPIAPALTESYFDYVNSKPAGSVWSTTSTTLRDFLLHRWSRRLTFGPLVTTDSGWTLTISIGKDNLAAAIVTGLSDRDLAIRVQLPPSSWIRRVPSPPCSTTGPSRTCANPAASCTCG